MSEYRVFVAPAYGVPGDPIREQVKVVNSEDQLCVEGVSAAGGTRTTYRVRLNGHWSYGTDDCTLREFAARYGTPEMLNSVEQANRGWSS